MRSPPGPQFGKARGVISWHAARKNETHSSPKCANLGADQAWKAELLFGEAGVARDDMPRTLLSQPHVWVGRWRDRRGERGILRLALISSAHSESAAPRDDD